MVIPVRIMERDEKFIFDTGIGPNAISSSLSAKLSLKNEGSFAGKRMSGQEVEMPLVKIKDISVSQVKRKDLRAGVFDFTGMPTELADISGFISPSFFENNVFTVSYRRREIIIRDDITDLSTGDVDHLVPVEIHWDHPSVTIFLNIVNPVGEVMKVEVDTGSSSLILDTKFMNRLDLSEEETSNILEGTDEMGSEYRRHFNSLIGRICLEKAPGVFQDNPKVIFQDIIYDGLIGDQFFSRFEVSYDLKNSFMGFNL